MIKVIHNVETGEITEVEMTAQEIEESQKNFLAEQERKVAKAEAQAKRQALLDKLGITEDEARLLLGGN